MVNGNGKSGGCILVAVPLLLLLALGKLDLVAILLPFSVLLSYGIVHLDNKKSRLTHGLGKG